MGRVNTIHDIACSLRSVINMPFSRLHPSLNVGYHVIHAVDVAFTFNVES
jgi:hypothetical protein